MTENTMELQDLESAWKALDARVAQQDLELAQLRSQTLASRMRGKLARASLGQWAQVAIGVLFAIWGGGYWFDHLGTPHLVAYGLALHAYGIALLGTGIVLLVRMATIDYALPIAEVQSRLLVLRRDRIRSERVLWLFGAVMWVPIMMIGLRAIGIDAWTGNPVWVLANLAVGVAIALVAAWVMHRRAAWFAKRSMDGPLADVERQLADIDALRR
jgi:hypothetical protein